MDSQQSNRTLDGNKLLTWMYENGYFSLKAADMIADEMEKGTFDKMADAFAANDRMIVEAARSAGMLADDNQQHLVRSIAEWHEDYGNVLWWRFPIEEPPYCGSPLDSDWPDYHTHWTTIII